MTMPSWLTNVGAKINSIPVAIRKPLVLILIVIIALFAGYEWGKIHAPVKTVEKEKVVTVEKQVVVKGETQVIERKIYVREPTAPPPVQPVQPDPVAGCPVCKTCIACPAVKETTTEEKVVTNTQERTETDKKEVEKKEQITTSLKANWRVSADAGLSLKEFLSARAIYGGEVERRLFGSPFWIGASANTDGYVFVKLSFEF